MAWVACSHDWDSAGGRRGVGVTGVLVTVGLARHAHVVGVNIGVVAGQTVAHAYVHVIPRYAGDVPDSRGGVRWVLPARAAYWEAE